MYHSIIGSLGYRFRVSLYHRFIGIYFSVSLDHRIVGVGRPLVSQFGVSMDHRIIGVGHPSVYHWYPRVGRQGHGGSQRVKVGC